MLKVLAWIVSRDMKFFVDATYILNRQHNGIKIIKITIGEDIVKIVEEYDVLLVVGAKQIGMSKITQVARQLNLPEEKLLGDWIVCIPGFTLEKYRRLQRSRLSIFSTNCFGGLISHLLGLPFLSPFMNLFLKRQDFNRFLKSPRNYMAENLILKEMKWNEGLNFNYPVVKMSDVEIYMNHYRDFETAKFNWDERKKRINWYNLFVITYTDEERILQEFDALPYGKKVCFVPFKSDLDSAWYIDPKIDFDRAEIGFHDVVNNFARGKIFYYDPFDMLLYGKKTPLIEM